MMAAMREAHYPDSPRPAPASAPPRASLAARAGRPIAAATLLAAGLALAGCGGKTARPASPPADSKRDWPLVPASDPAAANAVLMRALGLIGTPYRYGGNTPESGFDCSGLVAYVYRDVLDLRLPRTSRELAQAQGARIEPKRLATGDLVFFGSRDSVTHVGIYVGEGRFVHAPSSGGTVRLDHLDGHYWRDHYSGAKRVLR